jgi:hypothetical protein
MARRVAGKAVVRPIPKERRGRRGFIEGEDAHVQFRRYSGIDIDQAIQDLGTTIRRASLDDSDTELLVAWGRTCESRIGVALVIEDAIRVMPPLMAKQYRVKIINAALGKRDKP